MIIKTYLGFDVGTKRTGIAIANSLTTQANGLATVIHNKDGSTNWVQLEEIIKQHKPCLLYTSPSPRDRSLSRMPSSA